MKIIDLLNKIANDDRKPEIIKINTHIWYYDYDLDDYMSKESEYYLMNHYNMLKCLNYEVEIIKEKTNKHNIKKIKDKYSSQISKTELAQKINEIIDCLQELKGEE